VQFNLLLRYINRMLERCRFLPLFYSLFAFLRLGVCHKQIFISIIKSGEDYDIYVSCEPCLKFNEKKSVLYLVCAFSRYEVFYHVFHFESRSDVLVSLALDLCAGPEAIVFSRRHCVSGARSFTDLGCCRRTVSFSPRWDEVVLGDSLCR
jgi:hypothetical protein